MVRRMNEEKIWIEEKDFHDRTEFRIKMLLNYPKGMGRKGQYEEYMSEYKTQHYSDGSRGWREDYVFVAYKNNNWFKEFMGNDYDNQRIRAIQRCDELIIKYKQYLQTPRTSKHDR
jgi:hypothetical protein